MNRVSLKKSPAAGVAAGAVIAAVMLTAGAAWAGKDSSKVDVKTDAASSVQQAPDNLDPVRDMIETQREMNRFFGRPFAAFSMMPRMDAAFDGQFERPDMDLCEQADAYHVQMDLPGMDKSGITVEVKDNILTVKAERKQESVKKDGERLLMQERSGGFMSRAVMLSKPVDAAKVTAEYKDGVLKITLPKVQKDQAPRQVEIK
ncbi:MAG: Hsp20/alpha crystallin family protein [Kiritimatiellales bacterium]|jgi:HSP20 family protein